MVPPVEIHTDAHLAAASLFWTVEGRTFLTILAKATFAMVPGGVAELAAPLPIEREDRTFGNHPARSVEAASDLAPWRPRCDVTFIGSAHASSGKPATATSARLAVFRDGRALVDRTLHVYGDREGDVIKPFVAMPIVYERAMGGPGVSVNPVGSEAPNVVDAADAGRAGCFGPVARTWPSRKRLIKDVSREALSGPIVHVPEGFAWDYYQAAPDAQRIDRLTGGEWIVLDGLSATEARLQTQVPGLAAQVVLTGGDVSTRTQVALVADTLAIDGERRCFSIVWRGRHEILPAAMRDALVVGAALVAPGREVDWSTILAEPASTVPGSSPRGAPADAEGTMAVSEDAALRVLAPFAIASPGSGKTGDTSATPWGGAPAKVDAEGTIMAVHGVEHGPVLPFAHGPTPLASVASIAPRPPPPKPEVGGETVAAFGHAPDATPSWLDAKPAPAPLPAPSISAPPLTIGQQFAQAMLAAPRPAQAPSPTVEPEPPEPPPRARPSPPCSSARARPRKTSRGSSPKPIAARPRSTDVPRSGTT
ncbi:hypothetical protein A7982_13785 [Minicystis rosea]|nr:hypothetical protein A7982_13785 [Minicystis rosea]